MSKISVKFFIIIFLSILLLNSNSIAFHKENKQKTSKNTDWDGTNASKKNFANQAKQEFCSLSAKGIEVVEIGTGKPVINQKTGEQTISEDTKKPLFENKKVFKIEVSGYHSSKSKKVDSPLFPSKMSMNFNADWGKVKLVEVLKMYCLQDKTELRPAKFKGSYLEEFYTQVAKDNGYFKDDTEEGDYEKKFLDGSSGEKILKVGIVINNPNAVWYVPDFLEKQEFENKKREKAAFDEARKKKKAKEKREKEQKRERDWIAENKPPLIKEIKSKIQKFDDEITKYNNTVNTLSISHENFSKYFNEKYNEIEDLLDLVDVGQKEIKDKAIELKKAKREYLNDNILRNINSKFKKIKKKKGKEFKVYKEIKILYDEVEGSKKQNHFEKGYRSKFWTKKMPGFFVQWDRLSNRDLDIDKFFEKIDDINLDMNSAEADILQQIDTLQTEIQNLEEELASKWPTIEIVIGVIIFLVICVGGYFIYDSGQKRKREKEEAESKIASLKDDLEGKLKTTSEQIKSVSRTAAARSQQVDTSSAPEPVAEIPKTAEEIIAEKYNELLSDYKEALNDFTKVAVFKQKWHGLPLSRKERQDGSKTILVSSTRAFEKAGIWCVMVSDKYYAFPGSTVKSNMATYMNMDFMKAGQDFKGVFVISTGSTYLTEPAILRRGGVGFVVEGAGKIAFPD
jgi:hypothetical protein